MDLNLDSILGETAKMTDSLAGTAGQIAGITDDLGEISAQRVAANQDVANAASAKTAIDLQTVAQQEARRKAIAARFGNDATSAGWIIGQSVDQMVEAKKGADAANERIRAKNSISFLDNPLEYIAGKLTVQQDQADYSYWATKYNAAEGLAKDVESMTQQAFISSNAQTSTVSQAYIDSSKILAMHQYLDAGYQAAAQGARWNLEGIVAASNVGKDRLQLFYEGNRAVMGQKQLGMEMQRLQLSRDSFNLQAAAKNESLSEDKLVLKYIQSGFFNLTGKQMDGVRAQEAMILFKSKQPDIMAYFQNGMESASLGGRPLISLSPYDSSTLYASSKVQNVSPDQKIALDQLVTWRREFENPAVQSKMQLDPKDKTARERAFNQYVSEKQSMSLANVTEDSMFRPASLRQVGAVNPTVKMMPLWKNVLGPAAANGIGIDDPNIAFGLVTSALESGKIGYADATDLATIYQAGLEMNNQTKNFIAIGMPPARTYNTQVSLPNQIGKTTINLADGRAVATALNKVSANATSKILNQRTGNPFGLN